MALDLSKRLVAGVATSALFDLRESDAIFRSEGAEAYRAHQRAELDAPPPPGAAFPFIKRLLGLNAVRPGDPLVEAVILSKNDAETGRRAFRAIAHYGLPIERAAFLQGGEAHRFAPAFECELFLSGEPTDVRAALAAGQPAGLVKVGPPGGGPDADDPDDPELRVAFDFDGVLADDASERIFKEQGLEAFRQSEHRAREEPHAEGPLAPLLRRLSEIQALERAAEAERGYAPRLKTAVVTARGAPAHERVAASLAAWGLQVDQTFFLGGVEKTAVLQALRPHIFFDDQRVHLERAEAHVPCVHIPFGVANP